MIASWHPAQEDAEEWVVELHTHIHTHTHTHTHLGEGSRDPAARAAYRQSNRWVLSSSCYFNFMNTHFFVLPYGEATSTHTAVVLSTNAQK